MPVVDAEDVAKVVRLLVEPDNYITGQVITVDGGLTHTWMPRSIKRRIHPREFP